MPRHGFKLSLRAAVPGVVVAQTEAGHTDLRCAADGATGNILSTLPDCP
jgi:hypothetical protein